MIKQMLLLIQNPVVRTVLLSIVLILVLFNIETPTLKNDVFTNSEPTDQRVATQSHRE